MMGKKLLLLLLVLIIVVPVGILVADLALTVSSFDPDAITVDHSAVVPVLSTDNSSFEYSFSIEVSTPPAGFLPKSAVVTVQISDTNGTLSHMIVEEFPLGSTVNKTISGVVSLTALLQAIIDGGGNVSFTLSGVVTVKILGFEIPGLSFALPDQSFNLTG